MRAKSQARGADELMSATVSQTIQDLEEELAMVVEYERYVSIRMCSLLDRAIRSSSASWSSDNIHSDSMDMENVDA